MRTIEIPLETGVVITYKAENLCKLVEVKAGPPFYHQDMSAAIDAGEPYDFTKCRRAIELVVLERWGSEQRPDCDHKIVILQLNEPFQLTVPYEPILSRRGKFTIGVQDYYIFQI